MATAEQKENRLLTAKIAVALRDEFGRVPKQDVFKRWLTIGYERQGGDCAGVVAGGDSQRIIQNSTVKIASGPLTCADAGRRGVDKGLLNNPLSLSLPVSIIEAA